MPKKLVAVILVLVTCVDVCAITINLERESIQIVDVEEEKRDSEKDNKEDNLKEKYFDKETKYQVSTGNSTNFFEHSQMSGLTCNLQIFTPPPEN